MLLKRGHVLAGVSDDIRDNPHGRLGRVDVRVPHEELFEDVVLDRTAQC